MIYLSVTIQTAIAEVKSPFNFLQIITTALEYRLEKNSSFTTQPRAQRYNKVSRSLEITHPLSTKYIVRSEWSQCISGYYVTNQTIN